MDGPPYKSALSNVSAFNHERVPMLYLQRLSALEANNWTNMSPMMIEHGVACGVHCNCYIHLHKAAL